MRRVGCDLIDPTIAAHNGRVDKRTGDGVEFAFPVRFDCHMIKWPGACQEDPLRQKARQLIIQFSCLGCVTFAIDVGHAQNSAEPNGGILSAPMGPSTGGTFGGFNDLAKRHVGLNGKPCISVGGSSKAQAINPDIFEHWVTASNSCGQHIRLNVCYYKTQHCVIVDVPAWGRRDTVLGIFPALRDFRYEYTEKFF